MKNHQTIYLKKKNYYSFWYLLLLGFLPTILCAQATVLQQDWSKIYGNSGEDKFHAVTEATNGNIIAVGETSTSSQDGLVVMTNYNTGQEILRKNYGDRKDDKLVAVAQTLEGHFMLAGTKESVNKREKEAWLLKINASGKVMMEQVYGTSENDAFKDMVLMNDGSVAAVGIYNDGKNGDVWLVNIVNGKINKEIFLGKGEYESVTAMTKLADGSIVLTGNAKKSSKSKKGDIWVQRVKLDKRKGWVAHTPSFFGGKDWDEALDVTATNDGGYLVTGIQTVERQGLNAWMIKFDAYNNYLWDETEGGSDEDIANAVVQTEDGGFLLVGSSKSEKSGARYSKMWIVKTDKGGTKEWSRFYGQTKNDIGKAACILHDGTLVMAGTTESYGAKGQDAWLMRLKSGNVGYKNFLSSNVDVTANKFRINTVTGTLKEGDVTYMAFDMKNNGAVDIPDVQIKINPLSSVEGVKYWNQNYVGTLKAGEQKTVYVPVEATKDLEAGYTELALSMSAGTTPLQTFQTRIESTVSQAARVVYEQHQFSMGNNANETLTLNVKNDGDFPTKNVEVVVSYPAGITAVDGVSRRISNIPPGATKEAKFAFKLSNSYRSDEVSITCTVKEDGQEKIRKVLVRGGGAAAGGLASTLLILTSPDPDEMDISKITTDKNKFKFTAKAISSDIVKPEDFKVYVNNVPLDNSKFGEKELSPPESENNGLNSRNFTAGIPLNIGVNHIQVKVKNPTTGKDISTKTMIVNYDPRKANLHVLSIGPSHGDLKYTGKDATDFANAYRNQEGKLFERVWVNQLTTKEATNSNKIREALFDLKRRYGNEMVDNKISSKDVVLVFISSHGMKDNRTGDFKLLPSDYNPAYGTLYAIDYKTEVLNALNEIDCKKVVLIDACQSGSAKSAALSSSLIKINETIPGMSTIASCQENQLSYEDDLWENGAFTEAIMEAFENKKCSDDNGIFQASPDREITLKELYEFLQRRVPGLIRTYKKDAPTEQIPHRPFNQLNEDMPIFFVN